jgi:hypothetical protein
LEGFIQQALDKGRTVVIGQEHGLVYTDQIASDDTEVADTNLHLPGHPLPDRADWPDPPGNPLPYPDHRPDMAARR